MYVCMYVCMHLYAKLSLPLSLYVCMYMYVYIYIGICYIHTCALISYRLTLPPIVDFLIPSKAQIKNQLQKGSPAAGMVGQYGA